MTKKSKIILPTTTDDGRPKISYSQHKLWNDAKGFNTGLLGQFEYIRKYFMKERFPGGAYADFGTEVQEYIQERKHAEKFDDKEKAILESIEPLDLFEEEFALDMGDFVVQCFIDDSKEDFSFIRDYKTASDSSRKKYYQDDYDQLDVYALAVHDEFKIIPKVELKIIERSGNAFSGGRKALKVAGEVWTHELKMDKTKLNNMDKALRKSVQEISDFYQVYLKVAGKDEE